jgi:hypothetical protein
LFSAITVSCLVRSLDDLEPNYQQQTALLLHQLLNGRDPDLAIISDPTIPSKPTRLVIAVNCLWCTSLIISISACIYAMSLKWWVTEYERDEDPGRNLVRACRRHARFMIFKRLNVPALIAFLPTLLLRSIDLFFVGAVMYFWQLNKEAGITCLVVGVFFFAAYYWFIVIPAMRDHAFDNYPTFISYQPPVAIAKAATHIARGIARPCRFVRHYVTEAVLFPGVQAVSDKGILYHIHEKTQKKTRDTTPHNPPDDSYTSPKVQEEAILWLSEVPLDPSDFKPLIPSLALVSSSRPWDRLQKPVVGLANSALETSFPEKVGEGQADTAIECILILGNIKFQSAVDENSDHDHSIGGSDVVPFVAWAAQQLANAPQLDFDTTHFGGIQERLLTAAAWLSPVGRAEDMERNGGKLDIQDRLQFVNRIRTALERHVRNDKPVDNKVLINLIHGMHACIPRGNYGSVSRVVSFLPLFCEDYDPPCSEDKVVLGALITYALDLLLSDGRKPLADWRKLLVDWRKLFAGWRKPLVDRRIEFDDLASELIDALMTNTTYPDVVTFAFWLIRRVPYEFKSRKTALTDIASIWVRTNEEIPEDDRERLNFHATNAFIAVAQHHVVAIGGPPRLTLLKLLSAALERNHNRPRTIYAIAMILYLGTSTQVPTIASEIKVGSIVDALFSDPSDLEKGVREKDVDTRIYSTLILLKLPPTVEFDVEKVKGLIVQTEEAIGDPFVRDSGVAKKSEADIGVDFDRARWKAVYLSALLFKLLPGDERGKYIEGLWTRVRTLLESEGLSFMSGFRHCLEPLGVDVSELGTHVEGGVASIFEDWIRGFPLLQLESGLPQGQVDNRSSSLNPRQRFWRKRFYTI